MSEKINIPKEEIDKAIKEVCSERVIDEIVGKFIIYGGGDPKYPIFYNPGSYYSPLRFFYGEMLKKFVRYLGLKFCATAYKKLIIKYCDKKIYGSLLATFNKMNSENKEFEGDIEIWPSNKKASYILQCPKNVEERICKGLDNLNLKYVEAIIIPNRERYITLIGETNVSLAKYDEKTIGSIEYAIQKIVSVLETSPRIVLPKIYPLSIRDITSYAAYSAVDLALIHCGINPKTIFDTASIVSMLKNANNHRLVIFNGLPEIKIEELKEKSYQSGINFDVKKNDNSESQVVISGDKNAVKAVCEKMEININFGGKTSDSIGDLKHVYYISKSISEAMESGCLPTYGNEDKLIEYIKLLFDDGYYRHCLIKEVSLKKVTLIDYVKFVNNTPDFRQRHGCVHKSVIKLLDLETNISKLKKLKKIWEMAKKNPKKSFLFVFMVILAILSMCFPEFAFLKEVLSIIKIFL